MRFAVAFSFAVVVVACTGGGDTTGTSSGGSTADGGGGGGSSSSSSGGSSSGGSSSGEAGASSSGTSGCKGTLTILVTNGQTSSCSHPIPAGVDRDNLNVYYSPGGGVLQKLCQTSRTSCQQWKGWFFLGEEIAFCDETCSKIDEGPDSSFLIETGCPTTDCF